MIEENIRLELFTVQQVRDWLKTGVDERGLSEEVISQTRAWSIIHNPYAADDLNIVSAIFVDDEVAAYTHLFPDESRGERMYWNTTIYCAPKYEGRGFAAIVIGQFYELYGERYFDLDAEPESVANLKFCGLDVDLVPQYILSGKSIRGNGIRAGLARLQEKIQYAFSNRKYSLIKDIKTADYTIKYTSSVNDKVYAFIKEHSINDIFLRSQDMFNWILNYPLMQDTPLADRVERDSRFSSKKLGFRMIGVEVYMQHQLIGFYILNVCAKSIDVSYIYFELMYESAVYLSIAEHVLCFQSQQVMMSHEPLMRFIQRYKLYAKCVKRMKAFSHPPKFEFDTTKSMQSGDGDNLT